MKLLLDTHVWHWAAAGDPRLSEVAADLIDSDHELLLSAISVWEFKVHIRRGRIAVRGDPNAWIRQSLVSMEITIVPINTEIALMSEDLVDFGNRDPADRFIVATAVHLGLPVVSADHVVQSWPGVQTLW